MFSSSACLPFTNVFHLCAIILELGTDGDNTVNGATHFVFVIEVLIENYPWQYLFDVDCSVDGFVL